MVEIDIDVNLGGMLPITVAPTSTDVTILQGGGRFVGWSLRDVASTAPAETTGSVVAPAANAVIASLTGLAAGTYTVNWNVGLQGAAAAADADNFFLYSTSQNIMGSVNPGAAGDYPQAPAQITVNAGDTVAVKAVAVGTAGVTYVVSITLTPVQQVAAVAEFQDGANILGEVALGVTGAQTRTYGDHGVPVFGKVVLHVISGTVTGTAFVIPSRGSQ